MTREFKFRFWDEEMKSYWDWEEIQDDWESDGYFDTAFRQDHWTCEQFTGLYDKNGKEIYEGDILFVKTLDWKKKERWDAEEVKTYWSVEYKNYWNHCGFMVFGINRRFHKPLTRTVIFNSEAEVIGNIHQNPELLKESK